MGRETEFFIEVHPGAALEDKILVTKECVKDLLGNAIVDDPSQTKFLRDTPHFTMQVAHVDDYDAVLDAYRGVAARFKPIAFTVDGVGQKDKGGLIEVHATVAPADQRKFRDIHYALIEAARPHLAATPPRMFPATAFAGYEGENLRYCHFPPGRGNYAPHASVGRFKAELLERVDLKAVLGGFTPQGEYTSGGLIVWEYKLNDPTFGVHNQVRIPLQ